MTVSAKIHCAASNFLDIVHATSYVMHAEPRYTLHSTSLVLQQGNLSKDRLITNTNIHFLFSPWFCLCL